MNDNTKFQALTTGIIKYAQPTIDKIMAASLKGQPLSLSPDEVKGMASMLILVTEMLAGSVKALKAKTRA